MSGLERAMWPPHPNPLPLNTHSRKATSLAGERGPEACWRPGGPGPGEILHGVASQASSAGNPAVSATGQPFSGSIANRKDAFHPLTVIAEFFERTEPQRIVRETSVVFRSAKDRPFAERKATIRLLLFERCLLCLVPGQSTVTDQVFPSRFMHVSELLRMGADIRREGESALITGVAHLSGAHVMASDLRGNVGSGSRLSWSFALPTRT